VKGVLFRNSLEFKEFFFFFLEGKREPEDKMLGRGFLELFLDPFGRFCRIQGILKAVEDL